MEAFRGTIASREGDWPQALRSVVDAVTAQYAHDPSMIMAPPFFGISIALSRLGDFTSSAITLGFVQSHYPGVVLDPVSAAVLGETIGLLHEHLDGDERERLRARGAALDLRQIVAFAQEAAASFPVGATS